MGEITEFRDRFEGEKPVGERRINLIVNSLVATGAASFLSAAIVFNEDGPKSFGGALVALGVSSILAALTIDDAYVPDIQPIDSGSEWEQVHPPKEVIPLPERDK